MENTKFILIYITHKNLRQAKRISSLLLEKKIIACVNYFPITSSYWWKGKITTANEIVTLVKTRKENWSKVKKTILTVHPYETPCIMKFDVESNESYAKWIQRETKV